MYCKNSNSFFHLCISLQFHPRANPVNSWVNIFPESCLCLCAHVGAHTHTHTHTPIYTHCLISDYTLFYEIWNVHSTILFFSLLPSKTSPGYKIFYLASTLVRYILFILPPIYGKETWNVIFLHTYLSPKMIIFYARFLE